MAAPPVVLLAVALVLMLARRGAAASSSARSLAGAQLVTAQRTGGTDAHAWTATRFSALRDFLTAARGLDAARAAAVAAAVVAHWARETGWGRAEWLYNVGNIRAFHGWTGRYQVLPDGLSYRAYATLRDALADTVALLEAPRYRAAWDQLAADGDGARWYDALMRAGWHPWSQASVDEYRAVRATVRDRVGA